MIKNLTTSNIARQNVLNNQYALKEVENVIGLKGVIFEGEIKFTKSQLASFFETSERSIDNIITNNEAEVAQNGYGVLSGNRLKEFKLAIQDQFDNEVNFAIKTNNKLGVFNFRAFVNIAMLLSRSDRAKEVRNVVLDIVLDTINKRTGGATKYINQRDGDFLITLLQNSGYHKRLVEALNECVDLGVIKFIIYNDKVYKSIFRENATEYRKILKLDEQEDERNTMYGEVLDIIASFEAGFADELHSRMIEFGRKLSQDETDKLYHRFETQKLWEPLINTARRKMASRDLCFRDALHENLAEYVESVSSEDFERFIGSKSVALDEQITNYVNALIRLKERK
ncbi:MAG: DNA-binding protein [Rikenellaceae bacterium]